MIKEIRLYSSCSLVGVYIQLHDEPGRRIHSLVLPNETFKNKHLDRCLRSLTISLTSPGTIESLPAFATKQSWHLSAVPANPPANPTSVLKQLIMSSPRSFRRVDQRSDQRMMKLRLSQSHRFESGSNIPSSILGPFNKFSTSWAASNGTIG